MNMNNFNIITNSYERTERGYIHSAIRSLYVYGKL